MADPWLERVNDALWKYDHENLDVRGVAEELRPHTTPDLPKDREAKIHGEYVTLRVEEWRRITDELTQRRTQMADWEEENPPAHPLSEETRTAPNVDPPHKEALPADYDMRRDALAIAAQWAAGLGSTSTTGVKNLAAAILPFLKGEHDAEPS